MGSPAHSGGVYGVAWSPDGKQLLTASGDKTAKLWDVETRQVVSEFVLGNTVEDQQVCCLDVFVCLYVLIFLFLIGVMFMAKSVPINCIIEWIYQLFGCK